MQRRERIAQIVQLLMIGLWIAQAGLYAQGRGGGRGGGAAAPPQSAKAAAAIDLTGYWVSVITEDWRYRMVTPSRGDYQGDGRSEEHTSELQSRLHLVCR